MEERADAFDSRSSAALSVALAAALSKVAALRSAAALLHSRVAVSISARQERNASRGADLVPSKGTSGRISGTKSSSGIENGTGLRLEGGEAAFPLARVRLRVRAGPNTEAARPRARVRVGPGKGQEIN